MKKLMIIMVAMFATISLATTAMAASATGYGVASQGQSQGIDMSNSFNSAQPLRAFPIAPATTLVDVQPAQTFAQPTPDLGAYFISIRNLIPILNAVDISKAYKNGDAEEEINVVVQELVRVPDAAVSKVCFSVMDKTTMENMKDLSPLAVISLQSEDTVVNSAMLARRLAEAAIKVGGSKVVFISEGVRIEMHGSNFGIGFNPSISVVSGAGLAEGIGGVAGGGTGYSSAKAGYVKLPYLNAVILK